MNKRKIIILISVIVALVILGCVGILATSKIKASQLEKRLDKAETYFDDLEYQKALEVYREILTSDAKNVDAYLGMADTYIAMGEYEEALQILEEGYEETDEAAIKRKMKKVEKSDASESAEPEISAEPQATEEPKATEGPKEIVEESPVAVEVIVTYTHEDAYVEDYGMMEHEGAIITGFAEDGTEVWKYEAEKYPRYDFPEMSEIGTHGNMFYFKNRGMLMAFEVATGKIRWETNWRSSSVVNYAFDKEENMYLTGSSGPDLLIISPQGDELKRIDSLDGDYYWPCNIEWIDDYVFITYEGYSDLAYDGGKRVLSYCLTDGTIGYEQEADTSTGSGEVENEEAFLQDDYVIEWKDANLEVAMRDNVRIYDRAILYGDIKDITGLDLSYYDIRDISALSCLTNLKWIYLMGNPINDISSLGNLTNLEELYLSDTSITSVEALNSLAKLKILSLSGNAISDISELRSLTNLKELYLFNNAISDIDVLANLMNLEILSLSNNTISDISGLSALKKLKKLDLTHNAINDISALNGLSNLKELNLGHNTINNVSGLSTLVNLQYLYLEHNVITDISGLGDLIHLEGLHLYNNAIIDISTLSNLINLRTLNINDNAIEDVSALSELVNLELLDLSNNPVVDYSPVSHVKGLHQ